MARTVADELARKFDLPGVTFDFADLYASDLQGRATSAAKLAAIEGMTARHGVADCRLDARGGSRVSRVTITADHAELIARKLGAVASQRVRRKAVNEAGKGARKELPELIAAVYSTTKAGVGARGKAAAPGAADPIYRLILNRRIRIARLKASARQFKAPRGQRTGRLRLKQGAKTTHFRAEKGEGRGEFILPENRFRARKRRKLGGVPISLSQDRSIKRRREQIGEDLAAGLVSAMEAVLKRSAR